MTGRLPRLVTLLGLALAALAPATAAVAAPLPRGFFGVVPQGPLTARDLSRMRGTVGTLRVSFGWSDGEPQPGRYDFDSFDRLVGLAADRGIRVLPFVSSTPLWLTGDSQRPPQGTARGRRAWRAFLRRLVLRYGPGGAFWRGRARRLPIRRWQIWNEPNFRLAWHPRISPRGYVRLLGIAARAIRGVDPGARIVAAAVAPVEAGMLPWRFLRAMYRVRGARRDFDLMAVNPYASSVRGVEYEIRRIRRAMADAGDVRKPLRVTELGVASDGAIRNPFDKGRQGQARFLARAYGRLIAQRRRWRIAGVDWFAWQDLGYTDRNCVFCQYAGLFDLEERPKPAWRALRRLARASTAPRRARASSAFSHGRETVAVSPEWATEDVQPLPRRRLLLLGHLNDKWWERGLVELRPDGSVDRGFGDDGVLRIGYAAVASDRRGRLVLVSSTEAGPDGARDATVTRLLADGRIDDSFGDRGTTVVDFGRRLDSGTAVHMQPNGRILVGGVSASYSEPRGGSDGIPVVARLSPDGAREWRFGRRGVTRLGGNTPLEEGGSVQSFADGPRGGAFALAGGETQVEVVRLRAGGAVDRSYGHRGSVTVGGFEVEPGIEFFDPVLRLFALPGGRVVLAGTASGDREGRPSYWPMALRLRRDGRRDSTFGKLGRAFARFSGEAFVESFSVQRSGRVVMVASIHPRARRSDLGLVSLRRDGGLDRRFGHRGRLRLHFREWTAAQGLVVQPPGRVVAMGLAQDEKPPYRPNQTVLARVPLVRHRVR